MARDAAARGRARLEAEGPLLRERGRLQEETLREHARLQEEAEQRAIARARRPGRGTTFGGRDESEETEMERARGRQRLRGYQGGGEVVDDPYYVDQSDPYTAAPEPRGQRIADLVAPAIPAGVPMQNAPEVQQSDPYTGNLNPPPTQDI